MKTIVIVGGGRNVGKTTLARRFEKLLPGSVVAKLGHHPPKGNKPGNYFPTGTSFRHIERRVSDFDFLILESGSVLDDPDFEPDIVIFLPTVERGREDKPGSERRRARAHIVRGVPLPQDLRKQLANRLGIGEGLFDDLFAAVNASPKSRRNPIRP